MATTETTPPLPSELPILPIRQTVAFPLTLAPLAVNRAVSIESINRALASNRMILMLLQENDVDDPQPADLRRIGTVGIIRQMAKTPAGINILVEGLVRARAHEITRSDLLLRASLEPLPERVDRSIEVDAHMRRLQELIERALSLSTGLAQELRGAVMSIEDPLRLTYLLASMLDMKGDEKQRLLETDDLAAKLSIVETALMREIALLELKSKIESQAQQEMSDAQRQYYLRQQLKAIQQELGEGEQGEGFELRTRVADAKLPEHVAAVAEREIARFERMGPASPESQMIRTYIDWLLEVPWSVSTEDRLDPIEARRTLDEDIDSCGGFRHLTNDADGANAPQICRLRVVDIVLLKEHQDHPVGCERAVDALDRHGAIDRQRCKRQRKRHGLANRKDRELTGKRRRRLGRSHDLFNVEVAEECHGRGKQG